MIYYVMKPEEWLSVREEDEYWPENFDELGYIPCAEPGQLELLIKDLGFENSRSLYVLKIDPQQIESVIIYEDVFERGMMFPHVYGYINSDAVTDTELIEPCPAS
ncbi:DUF952 domain-containing protein [Salisediminibacterium halotolerans]|uniref:Uncharacterized conserved protein, DUF952 family n=1 Tax=Salisediminibacterium halotolerans TaxID=517425 RepID=A0A1H9RMH3_9BACI|nr:DUF952 domain-containing protein [Salisediminibacterium haloalkalitolerans]SER74000.1 Uncharacterized conserved protein, DUF952 family [Salisediminibacterium haloalkalitolerans]